MSIEICTRARRYLAKTPPAISGQGGHNATYRAAILLVHGFALSEADAFVVLQEYNQRCQPPWSVSELRHKLKSAGCVVHLLPRGHLLGDARAPGASHFRPLPPVALPPKPKFQRTVLRRIASQVSAISNMVRFLADRSVVKVAGLDSASVLAELYPRGTGEQVLIFNDLESQGQFLWEADQPPDRQRSRLPAGQDGVWFLPQPVTGHFHPNPRAEGRPSRRSQEAVTAWRYAVLESDEADADDWLRCLVQMPLRIASICESGKRSIHALVRVDVASKAEWDKFMEPIKPTLITLGADPGALTAVRLSRLPQAMRGARCQRLLYLSPNPIGLPIFQQNGETRK